MKTSTLPSIRVDDEFRAAVESVLTEGETLTTFIEATLRRAVEHRHIQREFVQQAQRGYEDYQRTGVSYSADEVFGRVRTKVDARRKKMLGG